MISHRKRTTDENFVLESNNLYQKDMPVSALPDKSHQQIKLKKPEISSDAADNLFKRVQDFNDDMHKKPATEVVRETAFKGLQNHDRELEEQSELEEVKVIKKKRIPKDQIRKLSAKSKAQMELFEEQEKQLKLQEKAQY